MIRRSRYLTILVTTAALLILSLSVGASMAAAQSDTLTIPANTIIRGEPGDIVELGRIAVDTSLAGPLCTWSATATNQASTHPGTDILVQSNGTTLVLPDIEATPNKVTSNSGSVALATEVVVSVRLGPDGRFSGRLDLVISYSSCQPRTTTTTTQPTTTEPTTTEPTTTTETTVVTTPTTLPITTTDTEPVGPEVSQTDPTTTAAPTTATPTTATPTTATPTTMTDVLPVTGSATTMPAAAIGIVVLGAGIALTTIARQRRQT